MSSLLVRVSDLTVTDKPYQTLISANPLFMAVSKLFSKCLIFNFFLLVLRISVSSFCSKIRSL